MADIKEIAYQINNNYSGIGHYEYGRCFSAGQFLFAFRRLPLLKPIQLPPKVVQHS